MIPRKGDGEEHPPREVHESSKKDNLIALFLNEGSPLLPSPLPH